MLNNFRKFSFPSIEKRCTKGKDTDRKRKKEKKKKKKEKKEKKGKKRKKRKKKKKKEKKEKKEKKRKKRKKRENVLNDMAALRLHIKHFFPLGFLIWATYLYHLI